MDQRDHEAHLLRLSPQDRRARFHAALSDDSIIAYSRGIDWDRALIFGIFVDGTLSGIGELLAPDTGGTAEASLSIEKPYRRAHWGRLLVLALTLAARNSGCRTMHLDYEAGNRGMQALAQELGATSAMSGGVFHAVKTIPPRGNSVALEPAA